MVVAPAYKTVVPSGAALDRMRQALSASGYDLVAFTSSSTASNFVGNRGQADARNESRGDRSDHCGDREELGFEVVVTPREYTVPALVAAIRDYFAYRSDQRCRVNHEALRHSKSDTDSMSPLRLLLSVSVPLWLLRSRGGALWHFR